MHGGCFTFSHRSIFCNVHHWLYCNKITDIIYFLNPLYNRPICDFLYQKYLSHYWYQFTTQEIKSALRQHTGTRQYICDWELDWWIDLVLLSFVPYETIILVRHVRIYRSYLSFNQLQAISTIIKDVPTTETLLCFFFNLWKTFLQINRTLKG